MEPVVQSGFVEVRRVAERGRGGRGVFARCSIAAGTLIERVPVILIPEDQVFGESPTARRAGRIARYVFDWDPRRGRRYVALPLGYGSLYNHSYRPNAEYMHEGPDLLAFVALAHIEKDDEITVNYNGEPTDTSPVGFMVKE